tara:strand:+ start:269 stop:544 length:276 start_codon:yes stop_codon:yes gene_type:complete
MLLGLIEVLDTCPKDAVFERGFSNPHSYRGHYSELAVEPEEDQKVTDMLDCLWAVLDTTLEGYKGGEFLMDGSVDVYLSMYSTTSTTLVTG